MFDLGWTELLLIGVVALIVIGPKDLPGMFRSLGRFTGKMRGMAREFQRAMDEAADESGVKDIKNIGGDVSRTLKTATNPVGAGFDAVKDATKGLTDPLSDVGPETRKLSEERAAAAEKIRKKAAEVANKRLEREAAEKAAAKTAEKAVEPAKKKPAARKTPAKKTPAKKPAAKKPAAKSAAAKTKPRKTTPRRKTTAKPKDDS